MLKDKTRNFINEGLTQERALEIKAAFDAGVAMCFAFHGEHDTRAQAALIRAVLEAHGDAIVADCDVFLSGVQPQAIGDAVLLIKKETDNESFNRMVDEIIIPSKLVSRAIFIAKADDSGVKRAAERELFESKSAVVKEANLLVDGNKLLLTVRRLNLAKREERV